MKKITYYFLAFILFNLIACEEYLNIKIPHCDFDLYSIDANSTIFVDCILDLMGDTILLPINVHFNFGGGDIINGKLIFSGGTIDGRLLNSKLEIEGDVKLKEPIFKLYPKRWESIIEGKVNSEIALKNTEEFEKLMYFTKELGATTFEIGKFNAYFEVTKVTSTTSNQNFYPHKEAINIPSNFHLKMSDSTHLRAFPGEVYVTNAALLAIYDVSNAKVSGGTLHGDRDEREYPGEENAEVGTHLLLIRSGVDAVVDGVTFENGSSGGLDINSDGFFIRPDDYKPTTNVTIKNCIFKNCRMMSIALTDGREITIQGNSFINTGQPSDNSDGGVVGYAINIEPWRTRDKDGNLLEYQKAFNILIQENTEQSSRVGFVAVTIGQDVTIANNDSESRIVFGYASGTKITGNRLVASESSSERFAIFAGGTGETVFNNEISFNEISGFALGIATSTTDVYVHNNIIDKCATGIQIQQTFDSRFNQNAIHASNMGINATNTHNNNVEVRANTIIAEGFLIYLTNLNNDAESIGYNMTFEGNHTKEYPKMITISNANGVRLLNNDIIGGVEIGNGSDIILDSNTIRPETSDGIRLYNSHSNVSIFNNVIYKASQFDCINNNSDTPEGITLSNNTCCK